MRKFLTADGYALDARWNTLMHGASAAPLLVRNTGNTTAQVDVLGDDLAAHEIAPGEEIVIEVPIGDLVLGRAEGTGQVIVGLFEDTDE